MRIDRMLLSSPTGKRELMPFAERDRSSPTHILARCSHRLVNPRMLSIDAVLEAQTSRADLCKETQARSSSRVRRQPERSRLQESTTMQRFSILLKGGYSGITTYDLRYLLGFPIQSRVM